MSRGRPHGEALARLVCGQALTLYPTTAMAMNRCAKPSGCNAQSVVRFFHRELASFQVGHHRVALAALPQLTPQAALVLRVGC